MNDNIGNIGRYFIKIILGVGRFYANELVYQHILKFVPPNGGPNLLGMVVEEIGQGCLELKFQCEKEKFESIKKEDVERWWKEFSEEARLGTELSSLSVLDFGKFESENFKESEAKFKREIHEQFIEWTSDLKPNSEDNDDFNKIDEIIRYVERKDEEDKAIDNDLASGVDETTIKDIETRVDFFRKRYQSEEKINFGNFSFEVKGKKIQGEVDLSEFKSPSFGENLPWEPVVFEEKDNQWEPTDSNSKLLIVLEGPSTPQNPYGIPFEESKDIQCDSIKNIHFDALMELELPYFVMDAFPFFDWRFTEKKFVMAKRNWIPAAYITRQRLQDLKDKGITHVSFHGHLSHMIGCLSVIEDNEKFQDAVQFILKRENTQKGFPPTMWNNSTSEYPPSKIIENLKKNNFLPNEIEFKDDSVTLQSGLIVGFFQHSSGKNATWTDNLPKFKEFLQNYKDSLSI